MTARGDGARGGRGEAAGTNKRYLVMARIRGNTFIMLDASTRVIAETYLAKVKTEPGWNRPSIELWIERETT